MIGNFVCFCFEAPIKGEFSSLRPAVLHNVSLSNPLRDAASVIPTRYRCRLSHPVYLLLYTATALRCHQLAVLCLNLDIYVSLVRLANVLLLSDVRIVEALSAVATRMSAGLVLNASTVNSY